MDVLNQYTEETVLDWEENDAIEPWEAGFIRGSIFYDEEFAESS